MPNAVPFTLITPLAVKFDGEAELVIAVGTEGEIGILPNHAPYLTALRPGVLRANVRDDSGGVRRLQLACSEGFMQALPGKITILADAALSGDEIDMDEARRDLAAAQEEQRAAGGDQAAWRRAQSKIDFANARLHVAAP
ncbi:MAG TPA: ATP synthase F1 subunit epsilon [Candidatus Acidoferrum sp.]|jgi:F-type H+-transporting ATPase subunit epsilon|nr:ATP synthase F1 subunit epsilon [Candidatus Acidoferrum sp.]